MANSSRILLPFLVSLSVVTRAGTIHGDSSAENASSGIVVEQVAKASAAEKADMRAGDVVVSWSRAPAPPANPQAAQGPIESPFDVSIVELEQLPRGPVTFAGRRGPTEMTWTLSPVVTLGLSLRPALPEALHALYRQGSDLLDSNSDAEAAELWRSAAAAAKQHNQSLLATWFLSEAATTWADAEAWREADLAYEDAIRSAEDAARPLVAAQLLRAWADTWRARGNWDRVEDSHRRALALHETLGPGSLGAAQSLHRLGVVAWIRWDLAAAADLFRQALVVREKLAPEGLEVAMTLSNLGMVADDRWDLATAEHYVQRATAIIEKLAPRSVYLAGCFTNLGNIAQDREDLAAAEDYYRRALSLYQELAPAGQELAITLTNLGELARDRGNLGAAGEHLRRALAIQEKLGAAGHDVAKSLLNLGGVAYDGGDLGAAEEYYRRSLVVEETLAPGGLDMALSLYSLAEVAKERGDLFAAAEHHRRALAIREKLAPGSVAEAESLHDLGVTYLRMGRLDTASGLLLKALDALESQTNKLGGTEEIRSSFAATYATCYHDSIEALIQLGRTEEALHVLERSRARSLLALLAERDVLFTADLPADLARERRLVDAEYDRVQAGIRGLNPGQDGAEIEKRLVRLPELRKKQEAIATRIRKASPRFASLQYPEPLDLAGVRNALDPGTVLLAYSVGPEKTVLFVVEAAAAEGSGLSVVSLPMGEKALREKVEAFRKAVQRPVDADGPALTTQAARLYDLLIRPAEPQIASSQRLLLSPDGPLHSLPFGALVREDARMPTAKASYLVEWKPLHVVGSASVYAQLKKARREEPSSTAELVAFGDPSYPPLSKEQAGRIGNPDVRSVTRDFSLVPLPFTRSEVEGIAGLFAGRTQKYLGEQATEERAKSLGMGARYVHFACHGYLDERFPLNSALALTIPEKPAEGQDNGLLQAWEIFDKVRLDADLVTLSACKTGLGKEMGGEGLLGLTRAFHYSGARSVLATLWAVSDRSTPLLMMRFYGYLKAGKSRDEALRAAQIDLIQTPARGKGSVDLSHPFRWAAFQLSGDWR